MDADLLLGLFVSLLLIVYLLYALIQPERF
jgi:K+-transporting ATPase KdpF subunit